MIDPQFEGRFRFVFQHSFIEGIMGQAGPQRKLKDVQKFPAIEWLQKKGGQKYIDDNRVSLNDLVESFSKEFGKGIYTRANVSNILNMMKLTPKGREPRQASKVKDEILRRLQRIEEFLQRGLGYTLE